MAFPATAAIEVAILVITGFAVSKVYFRVGPCW